MAIFKSSNSGIPFGNTAGRPASPGQGQPYFNGELQRLELYTGSTYGWQNIVAETPGVTGYSGTVLETNSTNTITITGTNFAAGATASLIGLDGTEYIATSTTVGNLTSISATFGAIPANNEPYDIKVTNPSNLYGVYYDILVVNDKPVWTTTSGSLGSYNQGQSVSIQLAATDEENNTLTYSISSGSLPTGLSLSSSGLISGTNSANSGTYSFTISVSDGSNIAQTRSFTIFSSYPTVSGGTLTSDATYYYRTFTGNGTLSVSANTLTADVLTVAGGGGGAGGNGSSGGGGAGGVVLSSSQSLTSNTYAITVGAPGAGGAGQGLTGSNGQNSQFASLTAAVGGGGGGGWNTNNGGQSGGSGGGAGGTNNTAGSGTSGQGNAGGTGYASNPYSGGGGGGAGGIGGNGTSANNGTPGNGGSGTNTYSSWLTAISSVMSGVSGWSTATSGGYIAGGGAGGSEMAGAQGQGSGGGAGGGGNRGAGQGGSYGPTAGITNTGGGGGAAGMYTGSYVNGAAGGSGIVIVRYTKASVGG